MYGVTCLNLQCAESKTRIQSYNKKPAVAEIADRTVLEIVID